MFAVVALRQNNAWVRGSNRRTGETTESKFRTRKFDFCDWEESERFPSMNSGQKFVKRVLCGPTGLLTDSRN
jgi:hypothetical protein